LAFPGTYNFSYYKGDTFELEVYPKLADGAPFNLEGYSSAFTISLARGEKGDANKIVAQSQISADNTHVSCAITPSDSAILPQGTTLVYDIEVSDSTATTYPLIYTLLTGTITVTEDIGDSTA
jgi:hypothetical protein